MKNDGSANDVVHNFLLRGQGPDSASCCSSLWPPEGGVEVGHSGAAVSSAHPGAQWSRGNRAGLDAEVLAQSGSRGDAEKPHFAAKLSCGLSVDCWSLWMFGLKLRPVLGLHLCLCIWLRGLRGAMVVKIVVPSSGSCSYGLGLGVPRGCLVVRAVSREHPSLVFILTIPFITVGIMRVFVFNWLWRRMQVLSMY